MSSGMDGVLGLPADLNTNGGSLQCNQRTAVVDIVASARDPLFRPFLRSSSAGDVDLLSPFCGFGEDAYLVRLHFNEAPGHCQEEPSLAFSITDFTDFQLGKKRRVPRQDAEVALGTRDLQFIDLLLNDSAFGSNDCELERTFRHVYFTAAIFSAFWRASSIVPTM
jgi:hypothetical protein